MNPIHPEFALSGTIFINKTNMKITISENADPNYLASVVQVSEVRPHPNADSLNLITVFGNQVIVGKDTQPGDKVIYFPVECCIAARYLSWANMFENTALNADPTAKKGYFNDKRRVKAVRLRGEVSQGIILPASKVAEFFGCDVSAFREGESFDTVGEFLFVEKYIPRTQTQGEAREPRDKQKAEGITKLLKPNQFRFHSKTTNLGNAVHTIKPSDFVSISTKMHGTSAVFGNLLCSRPLNWRDKLARFFGATVLTEEYKFVYSSRSVVKNRRDGTWTTDVWGLHAQELEPKIPQGFTLYGEIVGFAPGGKAIQKSYDYGMDIQTSEFYAYRLTFTDRNGDVIESDWQMLNDFCFSRGISVVPTYFYGKAADLFDLDPEDPAWNTKFLENLKETYLDKPCELCKNKVIREGICLRVENTVHKNAWKFKSPLFLVEESASRDKGEVSIEEEN